MSPVSGSCQPLPPLRVLVSYRRKPHGANTAQLGSSCFRFGAITKKKKTPCRDAVWCRGHVHVMRVARPGAARLSSPAAPLALEGFRGRMPAPAFYRTPASQTSPLSLAFRSRSGRCLSNSPRRSRNQVYIIRSHCCHVTCSSHPYHVAVKVGSCVTF